MVLRENVVVSNGSYKVLEWSTKFGIDPFLAELYRLFWFKKFFFFEYNGEKYKRSQGLIPKDTKKREENSTDPSTLKGPSFLQLKE